MHASLKLTACDADGPVRGLVRFDPGLVRFLSRGWGCASVHVNRQSGAYASDTALLLGDEAGRSMLTK